MGGFGSAQGMITSLKNNSRRTKREAFDGWTSSDKESKGIKSEPVSEEVLKEIRSKMKRQKTQERKKFFVIFLTVILFALFLGHHLSGLNGTDVNHFFAMFSR